MSDPAVEAARRAWDVTPPGEWDGERKRIAAAREALKPIRELHQRHTIKVCICQEECDIHEEGRCPVDSEMDVCRECDRLAEEVDPYFGERDIQPVAWPCATARLVYSSEELS